MLRGNVNHNLLIIALLTHCNTWDKHDKRKKYPGFTMSCSFKHDINKIYSYQKCLALSFHLKTSSTPACYFAFLCNTLHPTKLDRTEETLSCQINSFIFSFANIVLDSFEEDQDLSGGWLLYLDFACETFWMCRTES